MRVCAGLLVALLTGLTVPCSAQRYAVDRGIFQLGGSARISNFRALGSDNSTFQVIINPAVGYFVAPGVELTATLHLAHYSQDGDKLNQYGIGPGIAYYFRHRATKVNPYLALRTLYIHESLNPELGTEQTGHSFAWVGAAGAALFVSSSVAITAEAFYSHQSVSVNIADTEFSGTSEEYGTAFGISAYIF